MAGYTTYLGGIIPYITEPTKFFIAHIYIYIYVYICIYIYTPKTSSADTKLYSFTSEKSHSKMTHSSYN